MKKEFEDAPREKHSLKAKCADAPRENPEKADHEAPQNALIHRRSTREPAPRAPRGHFEARIERTLHAKTAK